MAALLRNQFEGHSSSAAVPGRAPSCDECARPSDHYLSHDRVTGQIKRIGLQIKLNGFTNILERFIFRFAGRCTTG
jgi:hypothetical protein